MSSSFIIELLK